MASLTFSHALLPLAGLDTAEPAESARPGFFARFVEALVESRRRAAEREIARLELSYGLRQGALDLPSLKVEPADLPFGR
jgi:hypothetical protein